VSFALRSLAAAWARHSDDTIDHAAAFIAASIPSRYDVVDVLGHPSLLGEIDCTNYEPDPQGLGTQASWSVAGGVMSAFDNLAPPGHWTRAMGVVPAGGAVAKVSAGSNVVDCGCTNDARTLGSGATLPTGTLTISPDTTPLPAAGNGYVGNQPIAWAGKTGTTLTGVTGGTGTWAIGTPVTRTRITMWWYALVRAEQAWQAVLRDDYNSSAVYATVALPATQAGWVIVGGAFSGQQYGRYRIWLETPANATATLALYLTGATVAEGSTDPGGPFDGSMPASQGYLIDWAGASNGSSSRRHTTLLDLVALREAEGGLDVDPSGMTLEQRRAYLIKRRQARHHPDAAVLVDLIVSLIQTENPGFGTGDVRIQRDYVNQAFGVKINYSPTGVLANRVQRLIESQRPRGITFTGVTWGSFVLDQSLLDSGVF
jgi:hypothetical protein